MRRQDLILVMAGVLVIFLKHCFRKVVLVIRVLKVLAGLVVSKAEDSRVKVVICKPASEWI